MLRYHGYDSYVEIPDTVDINDFATTTQVQVAVNTFQRR